jgi:hypothetical protein
MDIPALYVVLFFMGSVSTDPNVSLVQQSTTFHFSNDASGQKLCNESQRNLNAVIVRREERNFWGRIECHVMTGEQVGAVRKAMF